METIIVEREFEDRDAMRQCLEREAQIGQSTGSDQAADQVRCVVACGAQDGKHAVSMYRAENKAAVAAALAERDLPYERIWRGQPVLDNADENAAGFGPIMVQRVLPMQVTPQMAIEAFQAKKECYTLRQAGWDQTCIAEDGQRLVCWYHAPDAESVRAALNAAGMPYDIVWSAQMSHGSLPDLYAE